MRRADLPGGGDEVTKKFGRTRLTCSFCGKGEAEVAKLVAGPKVLICDRCVAIASRIMEDSGNASGPPPA